MVKKFNLWNETNFHRRVEHSVNMHTTDRGSEGKRIRCYCFSASLVHVHLSVCGVDNEQTALCVRKITWWAQFAIVKSRTERDGA